MFPYLTYYPPLVDETKPPPAKTDLEDGPMVIMCHLIEPNAWEYINFQTAQKYGRIIDGSPGILRECSPCARPARALRLIFGTCSGLLAPLGRNPIP